jgi:hypothetical protein
MNVIIGRRTEVMLGFGVASLEVVGVDCLNGSNAV